MNDVVDSTSSSADKLHAEDVEVIVASDEHIKYVDEILDTINRAAKVRGTGIAKRSPEYVSQKMHERKAVIALSKEGEFAGFSYIESWSNKQFVANSGLIVANKFRGIGLATRIKRRIFQLSRDMFPEAKIFSLTTGAAVMKMNFELGYRPVTFDELTDDAAFWKGCESCVNYDILQRNGGHKCLCTGLLYDPSEVKYHPENRFMQTNENPSVAPAHTEAPDGKLIEELEQLLATWKKGK
ncbi:MAG: GNAT family N-acetyltransferase [Muribaculaceae bacterium]|jgi:hypothetical protein|nr:GNAT family N-acetyltransferase [Muribaculaceae bacterium]